MMMKSTFSFLFALLATSTMFAAQRKVADVLIYAEDNYNIDPRQSVLEMCSIDTLKDGQLHDERDIQSTISADIEALLATPAYANARAEIGLDEASGDWVIIYTVSRRPQLAEEAAIVGLNGELSESRVCDVLNEDKSKNWRKIGTLHHIDDAIANEGLRRIRDLFVKKGYVDVEVTYELRYSDKPGYAYLTYLITPGKERVIKNYCFEGNTLFDHATLAGTFGWMPSYNPLSWFADFPTSDDQLETARVLVSNYYYNAGYLDVQVEPAQLTLVSEDDDEKCYDVLYKVNEGECYSIGNITVTGSTLFAQNLLEATAHQVIAQNNDATEANLRAIRNAIEKQYTTIGYINTYATPTLIPADEGHVMNISYAITEGERVRISAIDIKGVRVTDDKVIRREILITPGEYYNADLVEQSEARLKNLRYFVNNSVSSYTVQSPDDKPGDRHLVFEVEEDRTLTTSLTVGVSTVDNVFIAGSITERNFDLFNPGNNFRGGGQRASASVELGSRRQTVNLVWTQPWLFDMPLSFTVNGYRNLRWRDHYDEIRMGVKFDLSWKPQPIWTPFGEYQMDRLGLRYTIEDVSYDDVDEGSWTRPNGDHFAFEDETEGINSKLRLYWSENHLDRAFIPTAGWKSEVYAEVGIGGDAEDYGFGFNVSKYWNPCKDHVLMGRFRFNTLEAYGEEVPMFDRFFIGGPNTVRGFEFRDGGPKAYDSNGDHVAVGGQTLWCATAEYSIPLSSFLRFALFSDIGAVGEDFCDLGGDLLWSAGCGLRLDFEQFPIRIDLAKPITNDDDTEEEVFLFSIGNF